MTPAEQEQERIKTPLVRCDYPGCNDRHRAGTPCPTALREEQAARIRELEAEVRELRSRLAARDEMENVR